MLKRRLRFLKFISNNEPLFLILKHFTGAQPNENKWHLKQVTATYRIYVNENYTGVT